MPLFCAHYIHPEHGDERESIIEAKNLTLAVTICRRAIHRRGYRLVGVHEWEDAEILDPTEE